MNRIKTKLMIALAALTLSTSAGATLLGQTIQTHCGSVVVDGNVECRVFDGSVGDADDYIDIDVSSDSVVFTFGSMLTQSDSTWQWDDPTATSGVNFELVLGDLIWDGFPNVIISSITSTWAHFADPEGGLPEAGFDDHEVTLQVFFDTVWTDCQAQRTQDGVCATLTVDIIADHPINPPIDTPEPTTLALFGLGLAGLGLRRKKI